MLRSVKYGLHAAVLSGVLAGAVPAGVALLAAPSRHVDLVVDGRSVSVSTHAATVGQLLAAQRLHAGGHDILAPSRTTRLHDGMHVVLRHGRLLRLSIDGRPQRVWTTAPTVSGALDALGYTEADFVSVSRSQRLPLAPTALTIRTPRAVTLVHDGRRETVETTDGTVAQLLADLGVRLGPIDRLSAAGSSPLRANTTITLQRVVRRQRTRSVAVAYPIVLRKDRSLDSGTTHVERHGKAGRATVTYALVYVDGHYTGRIRVGYVLAVRPRTQVIVVGTRRIALPPNTPLQPVPAPGTPKAIARRLAAQRGWGEDQFSCLVAMWNRESGWRVDAANPSGAYGIPQALPGSKMGSAGPNWHTDPATQIAWGLGYIRDRYRSPCGAWTFWQAHNYY